MAISATTVRVPVEISSVPLYHGEHVVGVFGQVAAMVEEPHAHPELHLTPRQAEVLASFSSSSSSGRL